jgi:hypothetical protein
MAGHSDANGKKTNKTKQNNPKTGGSRKRLIDNGELRSFIVI